MPKRAHENSGTTLHARLRQFLLKTASPLARRARMRHFEATIRPVAATRVLDLGGTPRLWQHVQTPLRITILNLEVQPISKKVPPQHTIEIVTGDATATPYPDNAFDVVFSNSVIEHVGDATKRQAFATEVRRLAPRYYVQTPSRSFPLEAHTMLPFWWYYPGVVRQAMIRRWRSQRPAFADFIQATTVVGRRELKALFPDAIIHAERLAGMVKSRTVIR